MRAVGKKARMCCLQRLTCVRFYNHLEWLSFWKISGWILNKGPDQWAFNWYLVREYEQALRWTLQYQLVGVVAPLTIMQYVLFGL
jgi:hypothetical protein